MELIGGGGGDSTTSQPFCQYFLVVTCGTATENPSAAQKSIFTTDYKEKNRQGEWLSGHLQQQSISVLTF